MDLPLFRFNKLLKALINSIVDIFYETYIFEFIVKNKIRGLKMPGTKPLQYSYKVVPLPVCISILTCLKICKPPCKCRVNERSVHFYASAKDNVLHYQWINVIAMYFFILYKLKCSTMCFFVFLLMNINHNHDTLAQH